MIEHILFLPAIVSGIYEKLNISIIDQLARDFSVILLVNVLEKAGFQIFRRLFVSLVCLGLLTEIINDLCFRAIDPNPKFLDNWNHVYQERTQHLLNLVRASVQAKKTSSCTSSSFPDDSLAENKSSETTFPSTKKCVKIVFSENRG
jgi:hypothetical protein